MKLNERELDYIYELANCDGRDGLNAKELDALKTARMDLLKALAYQSTPGDASLALVRIYQSFKQIRTGVKSLKTGEAASSDWDHLIEGLKQFNSTKFDAEHFTQSRRVTTLSAM